MQMKIIWWVGGIFIAILILANIFPIAVIGAGQRGVVYNNFSGVENRILGEGTHFRTPFVESVTSMSVQEQATSLTEEAGSSDSQQIGITLTVNWHLDPNHVNRVFQQIGTEDVVVSNILTPIAEAQVKQAVSKYVALQVQKNRDAVSARALTLVQGQLRPYNIIVDNLSITNIQFSSQFNSAVEAAQSAQQQALQAQYQVATAKAQAQANQLKQQSLTSSILEQAAIAKWDGKLPTYLGSGALPFLNLNSTGQ